MKKNFPPKTILESVYSTIAFFDVFDRPIKRIEFPDYMLGRNVNYDNLRDFLDEDVNIDSNDGYYFLRGRREIVAGARFKNDVSDEFLARARRQMFVFNFIPFVRAVAVCNTVAFGAASPESDIDLFVITGRGRIFLARALTTLFFHILGVRRYGDKVAARLCLSFFVSEDGMHLDSVRRPDDVYLFFWMKTLIFIYVDSDDFVKDFYSANKWFLKVSDVEFTQKSGVKFYSFLKSIFEFFLGGRFGDFLEMQLRKWHLKRFEKRKKSLGITADVVVNDEMLKFHNVDRRGEFNDLFFENYGEII